MLSGVYTDDENGRQKLRDELKNHMKQTKPKATHPSFWWPI